MASGLVDAVKEVAYSPVDATTVRFLFFLTCFYLLKSIFERILKNTSDISNNHHIEKNKTFFQKRLALFETIFSDAVTASSIALTDPTNHRVSQYAKNILNADKTTYLYFEKSERQILREIHDVFVTASSEGKYDLDQMDILLERLKKCAK